VIKIANKNYKFLQKRQKLEIKEEKKLKIDKIVK